MFDIDITQYIGRMVTVVTIGTGYTERHFGTLIHASVIEGPDVLNPSVTLHFHEGKVVRWFFDDGPITILSPGSYSRTSES